MKQVALVQLRLGRRGIGLLSLPDHLQSLQRRDKVFSYGYHTYIPFGSDDENKFQILILLIS